MLLLVGCSGACLHPRKSSGHHSAGPSLRPRGLAAPEPASAFAGRGTGQRHLEAVVLGLGEGALGHRKIRSARGVDRRLQTLGGGGGGGNSGRPEIPNPGGGGARARPGPRQKGKEGRLGPRLLGPRLDVGEGVPGPQLRRGSPSPGL